MEGGEGETAEEDEENQGSDEGASEDSGEGDKAEETEITITDLPPEGNKRVNTDPRKPVDELLAEVSRLKEAALLREKSKSEMEAALRQDLATS